VYQSPLCSDMVRSQWLLFTRYSINHMELVPGSGGVTYRGREMERGSLHKVHEPAAHVSVKA
jgi:hypothetical protein